MGLSPSKCLKFLSVYVEISLSIICLLVYIQ